MHNPADEAKVLQILNAPSGNVVTDHPFFYPPTLSYQTSDLATLKAVELYNLATAHNNKLINRFHFLNPNESLRLSPGGLTRYVQNVHSVIADSAGGDELWREIKLLGFCIVFNFKDVDRYLFHNKDNRISDKGVFLGVRYTGSAGREYRLFEQMYYTIKIQTEEKKESDVQLVQQY